jgi:N-acetylmuramoyl-L-alanine amidase
MKNAKHILAIALIAVITALQLLPIVKYEYKHTSAVDTPLKNKTIVIDPGHGGIDGGASIGEHFHEKDINLDVALKLRELLLNEGAAVVLTRDRDVSLESKSGLSSSRYRRDLDARRNFINSSNADVFVSIHANCFRSNPRAKGAIAFYYQGSEHGELLAKWIAGSIDEIVYRKFLGDDALKSKVLPENLFILRSTKVPGILLETGYMTNKEEGRLLKQEEFRRAMAEAVLDGLKKYFAHPQPGFFNYQSDSLT